MKPERALYRALCDAVDNAAGELTDAQLEEAIGALLYAITDIGVRCGTQKFSVLSLDQILTAMKAEKVMVEDLVKTAYGLKAKKMPT